MNKAINYARHNARTVVNKIDHFVRPLTAQQVESALNDDLVLESCSLDDIETTYFNDLRIDQDSMLEAISCQRNKLQITIAAFGRTLNKNLSAADITADFRNAVIGRARKVGTAAIIAAKIMLSDGQSVSIVFHAPDNDPMIINNDDTLIAFRFLLNSRDITHVVAPRGGEEISLAQVTSNLTTVIKANTDKFQAKKAENAALKSTVDEAQEKGEKLEGEIAEINEKASTAKAAITKSTSTVEKIQNRIDKQNELQESLQSEIDSIKATATTKPKTPTPTATPTTSTDADSGKFVKHSESDNGDTVFTRTLNGIVYYFANKTVSLLDDKTTRATSGSRWLWGIELNRKGLPKCNDYDLAKTRKAALELALKDSEQLSKILPPLKVRYQDLLTEKGGEFIAAYNAGDKELLRSVSQAFSMATATLETDGMPTELMPILSLGYTDDTVERTISRLAEQGITGAVTPETPTPEPTPQSEPTAKYWYGMRIRPIGFGTQPDNHVAQMSAEQAAAKFSDFTERDYRYGAVGYANELTPDVIEHYNLTDFQKVVNPEADIDTARAAIEDVLLAKLKILHLKGFTQSEIDDYLQQFDEANGTNRDKIQKLFSKQLRKDFFYMGRTTDREGYKKWFASLDLIDKAMLTKYLNKVLVADSTPEPTPEPEKEPKLIAVGAGDRLTIDGEIYGVDSVSSDLIKITILDDSREQFVITDQEDPFLSRAKRAGYVFKGFVTEDSINEVIENGIESAKALAKSNLKKSDYQANGTLTFDGQDKLVDILARKGFDNTKAITVGNMNYVSLARCIVSKYNDALYMQATATTPTPEPTPEPQQTANTDGFKSTMADCLDNFKSGTVSLADTKKRIKALLKDSPQASGLLDRVNELLAQRAKAKFISAFNDVLDFESDAPVVDGIDFNNINFNMWDGHDDFGKSWAYVAKRNPQRLIGYVENDDTHGLTAANKVNIVAAIKAKYMAQAEPEPEPTPERTFNSVVDEYKSTLDEARDLGFKVTVNDKDGVSISYPDDSGSVDGAKPDDLDALEDFLSSELPFMIEKWQKGSNKREWEQSVSTLKKFIKGARLPDGWSFDKRDLESDDYEFAGVVIDSPLVGIVSDYGYYRLSVVNGGVTLANGSGSYLAKDGSSSERNPITYDSIKEVIGTAVKDLNDSEAFELLDAESNVDEIIKNAEAGDYSDAANKIILAYRDSKAAAAAAPEDSAEVESALADVKQIADHGTDYDDCLAKLESAYNVVNNAGKFEQYEDLFTLAQDKITELLTAAAAAAK